MGKNKKDLLKKKLIAQQMAQAATSFAASPAKPGEKAIAMPTHALKSKISAISTDEYSFVARDVKKIAVVLVFVLVAFGALYYFDQKMNILTRFANWVFEKVI